MVFPKQKRKKIHRVITTASLDAEIKTKSNASWSLATEILTHQKFVKLEHLSERFKRPFQKQPCQKSSFLSSTKHPQVSYSVSIRASHLGSKCLSLDFEWNEWIRFPGGVLCCQWSANMIERRLKDAITFGWVDKIANFEKKTWLWTHQRTIFTNITA